MYYLSLGLINVFLVANALCKNIENRNPRFLAYTTTDKYVTSTKTMIVPSSCVLVEATAACRNKRIYWSAPKNQSAVTGKVETRTEAPKNDSAKGWGEYFGIYNTVTQLLTKVETETITDPRIVVTYGVKQCIPEGFPMNLSSCEIQTAPVELPRQTILPSRIYQQPYQSTSLPVPELENNELEPSNAGVKDLEKKRVNRATDPLPF